MKKELIEKLSAITEEERGTLASGELDLGIYTAGETSVFKAARINRGGGEIALRLHTRFAEIPPHRHNFVEMVMLLSGSMRHVIDGDEAVMTAGDILIMNQHASHSIKPSKRGDVAINVIMCDSFFASLVPDLSGACFSDLVAENGKKNGSGCYLHFSTKGSAALENLIENIIIELTEGGEREVLRRTVALLLIKLSRTSELLRGGSSAVSTEQGRRAKIYDYIRESYASASLSELAEKLRLSPAHTSRFIVSRFGKSFKELLLEERLDRAEELLLKTEMPIGSVIRAVGYENASYFHREFKKRKGMTPLQTRRSKADLTGI